MQNRSQPHTTSVLVLALQCTDLQSRMSMAMHPSTAMTRGDPAVPANLAAASLAAAYTIAPARHDNGHQDVMGMQNSMQVLVGRTVPQMPTHSHWRRCAGQHVDEPPAQGQVERRGGGIHVLRYPQLQER
jgi:hypothetical protein